MPIDVELARAQTPGTRHVTHLDNAGSSLQPQVVVDTVIAHLQREANIGGYAAAAEANDSIEAVYDSVASLIGAGRDEIALVESATAAWNAAFAAVQLAPGDRIITARSEYASNAINMLTAQERCGAEIVVIDDDDDGQISLTALRDAIDERTRMIALTHVPTSGGLVNPAAAVGRIANETGVLFLLDACQAVGQLPIDVAELGCDMLSATGRKFLRGPRGTGFLYVRTEALASLRPALLDLRSATWTGPSSYTITDGARRFEEWEASFAIRLGLGAAVQHALGWGMDSIAARIAALAESLRGQLAGLPRVTVHDKGSQRCALVTFGVDGIAASDVKAVLAEASVNVSVTQAASARFDFPQRGLDALVRASPHYFNTESELAKLVEVVAGLT